MTYNIEGAAACSARGIAVRDSREELEALALALKEKICNVKIEENKTYSNKKKK